MVHVNSTTLTCDEGRLEFVAFGIDNPPRRVRLYRVIQLYISHAYLEGVGRHERWSTSGLTKSMLYLKGWLL